jgi:hypothetical protein
MEICGLSLILFLVILAIVLLIGVGGVVLLLKLGIIAQYWGKEEPPDSGDYSLDQSRSSDSD